MCLAENDSSTEDDENTEETGRKASSAGETGDSEEIGMNLLYNPICILRKKYHSCL